MYVDSTWSDHHARRQVELEAAATRSRLAAALRADRAERPSSRAPALLRLRPAAWSVPRPRSAP